MATYRLSEAADSDLERLYYFGIKSFGLALADQYYDGIVDRFQRIADMPRLYPTVDEIRKGHRRSVFGSHSIYYVLIDDGVKIVRILSREDPKRTF